MSKNNNKTESGSGSIKRLIDALAKNANHAENATPSVESFKENKVVEEPDASTAAGAVPRSDSNG